MSHQECAPVAGAGRCSPTAPGPQRPEALQTLSDTSRRSLLPTTRRRWPSRHGGRLMAVGAWAARGQEGLSAAAGSGCGWMAPRRLQDRTTGGDHRQSDRGTTPPRRPPALAHLPLRPFSVLVTRTLGTCSRPCAAMRRGAHAALIRALTTGDIPPQGLQVAWVLRPVVAPCRFTHATRWRTPVRRAVGGSIERPLRQTHQRGETERRPYRRGAWCGAPPGTTGPPGCRTRS